MAAWPRIDAHLHLWDLSRGGYRWITPELGELHQTFTAPQAHRELDAAGIAHAILVQADDSVADTEFMLETAADNSWIRGVVGWVRLDDPAVAQEQLEQWLQHRQFCGVRHLVHDDPRADFLSLAPVRQSLKRLAARDVPFDVPDAFPRHLAATARLAEDLPALTVVVDHLGKPPLGADSAAYAQWDAELARCARCPNTAAKVSGLRIPGAGYDVATLAPVFEIALELFGPERLMYGGDWPMNVPAGGYQPTWRVLDELIGRLSAHEQAMIGGGTAARIYHHADFSPATTQ